MKLLESAPIVEKFLERLKKDSAVLIDAGTTPHLAVVLVGAHPESLKYIDIKTKRAKEVGITVSLYHLEDDAPDADIASALDFLCTDEEVHGIIVQLPLPNRTSAQTQELLEHIAAEKDVDGLRNLWRDQAYTGITEHDLTQPQKYSLPPMVAAVGLLLSHYGIDVTGKEVVVVGRGVLVGQPLEAFFSKIGVKVQTVDEETEKILDTTRTADILISGTGSNDLITYQWVKEGAVVLDCAQDVHRDLVDQVASAVSPSVGGLGPLTVTWLLYNTIQAATNQSHQ